MPWWAPLLFAGCAARAQRLGIIDVDDARVELVETTGRRLRLAGGEPPGVLAALDGLTVQVSGPRVGRRLVVREWVVTDGGDGSAPYVGRLSRYGSHWRIEDQNSGSIILLEEASVGGLARSAGHLVLVTGFVVGAHEVRVVSWRDLSG